MTTEDDFQALLDADPDDFDTRGLLADFLDEIGDPRAAGYRWLWVNRVRPYREEVTAKNARDGRHIGVWFRWSRYTGRERERLPHNLFVGVAKANQMLGWEPTAHAYFHTRRGAEDALAMVLAVCRLIEAAGTAPDG